MEQNRFLREYRRVVAAAADVITGPHEEMRATTKMVACYGGCEEWMQRTAGSEWSAALIRRFLATSERFSEIGTHTKKADVVELREVRHSTVQFISYLLHLST